MNNRNAANEGRFVGGLIVTAALGAVMLMTHHPTSIDGNDDGLLLRDWSNAFVHGGMMVCLFVLIFAFAVLARRLGEGHLSVRAGAMAFTGGMTALAGAAVINGFVVGRLGAVLPDASSGALFAVLGLLNQTLALLGIALVSLATALWAVRMVRMDAMSKVAGVLGVVMAVTAGWWLIAGSGRFDLYPATVAVLSFALWASIVATQAIRGRL